MRLILGLIKGLVIGGGVGFAAYTLGFTGSWHWITYGAVGALVGLLVGRPFWSHMFDKNSTVFVALLKGIVGFGVGVGLYAVAGKLLAGSIEPFAIPGGLFGTETHALHDWQFVLGGAIGAIYGAWVELDDAPPKQSSDDKKPALKSA
jgi:hypothetical protein